MTKGAFPDVGDAFDVGMGMHSPGGAPDETIVIEDAQRADSQLIWIAIGFEGEVPASREPAVFLFVDLAVTPDLEHWVFRSNSGALRHSTLI